ncbi:MAG TPA: CGNR zinc finger domain-containing protein [Solirubrobacterales bacterium]|nr:CGNR zinc finger domain-containing protein [Solirubrobacterales bacterium]
MSTSLNKAAQEEADLLVAFVNTRDLEEGSDEIGDPERLREWIEEQTGEYLPAPDGEALARVLGLRESLRALLRANNGGETTDRQLAPLRDAAERSRYRTSLGADGELKLAPARADVGGFEARLLLAVERLQAQGAWPRLKACTDEGCQWAFLDATRNRSRTWCSMEECGNREKTRRYRARRGAATSSRRAASSPR